MSDELIALIEIVDALTAKLARDRQKDETLQIIAERARRLRERCYEQEPEGFPVR